MYKEQILDYYSREDVQKAILRSAEDREVVPILASGGFGARPNAVFYEKDVEQLVKEGAISFHGSVERWKNPLALRTEMRKDELDDLRIGWDLVIDIDCYRGIDYAIKAAQILVNALEQYGITSYGIKFSGNRGFHIGVPFEAFPEEIYALGKLEKLFPRMPRALIDYLRAFTYNEMKTAFKEKPEKVLTLDSALITSRHLIRLPYCLHRKTWLASIPISKDQLENFEKEQAKPENVKVKREFLRRSAKKNEALELLRSAIFWSSKRESTKKVELQDLKLPASAIKPDFFPPCIKNILNGLQDGRKRSIFVLITYLHHIGWKRPEIEKLLYSWNQKNNPPLRETLIKITLDNQYMRQAPQMAPNCDNLGYYKDFGICTPDEFCQKIKNPVTYTLLKVKGLKKSRRRRKRVIKGKKPIGERKNG